MDTYTENLRMIGSIGRSLQSPPDGDSLGYCPECDGEVFGDRWEWACSECEWGGDNLP